jgi:protein-disulfide isomerase
MIKARFADLLWGGVAIIAVLAVTVATQRQLAPAAPAQHQLVRRTITNGHLLSMTGHSMGPRDARVTITEFSDFECPFCRRLHGTVEELRSRYPSTLTVVFRHYPLAGHALAYPAAIAAECAAAQGAFEQFASLLFEKQDSLGRIPFEEFARRSGIRDTAAFHRCRGDVRTRSPIEADIKAGESIGITGTPAFLVGDRMIVGAAPADTILALLRENGTPP